MAKDPSSIIQSTKKQALYLWVGLNLSLTLFFVQSQMFFVKGNPLPSTQLEWIFIIMGLLTFIFAYLFYSFYTKARKNQIRQMPEAQRKQSLLVAFVLQFILFETLGLYGVLLSVLTQNTWKAIPFVVAAYIGFVLSFPRVAKIRPFF